MVQMFSSPEKPPEFEKTILTLFAYIQPFSEGTIVELLNWISKFTLAYKVLSIDEEIISLLFPTFLNGTAKTRYDSLPPRSRKNWKKTVKNLLNAFSTKHDWFLAGEEILNISQGSNTAAEFAFRLGLIGPIAYKHFHKKCREKLLVIHFLRNSNVELKQKLLTLCPMPSTLNGIVKEAEKVHASLNAEHVFLHHHDTLEQIRIIGNLLQNISVSSTNVEIPLIAAIDNVTEGSQNSDKCYFYMKRKTSIETTERYEKSEVSTNCSKTLYKIEDINELEMELYGAPSELALVIFRGSGLDVSSQNWENTKVCSDHLDELLLHWHRRKYHHIHIRTQIMSTSEVCSVPPLFVPLHHRSIRPLKKNTGDILTFDEAKIVLEKFGILLHPGIPLCQKHKLFVQEMVADKKKQHEESLVVEQSQILEEVAEPASSRSHRSSNTPLEETVYELGKLVGVTRIKPLYPFEMLAKRSQTRKANSVHVMIEAIIKTVAPGSESILRSMIYPVASDENEKSTMKLHYLLKFVSEEYCSAHTRQERNIVLSIVAKVLPFAHISKYIPGISFYVYDQARRVVHYTGGIGTTRRVRYHSESVNLFLEFITSNIVLSPFTHGTKIVKTSDNSLMELPNTIRKQGHAQIVSMFKNMIEEQGLTNKIVLSDSTCFRILAICAATPLKAATCVDYFLAQALESRDELISLFDTWEKDEEIDETTKVSMRKQLESIIHYYRSDYRIHVKMESRVADHCCLHALSEANDPLLSENCNHEHDWSCEKCEMFKEFGSLVQETVQGITKRLVFLSKRKDVDAMRRYPDYRHHEHIVNRSLSQIENFKKHILRSSFTDGERSKIINDLQENEALVTLDFAQKLLVQKHYETQKDYFGKRGMSYHVTHVLAKVEGHLAAHAIVHILRGDLQDTLAVTAIIDHSLRELKKMGIKAVTLRSDNAGNYHCNQTISSLISLSEETGVQIKRYAFSEAQNGKSSCDRIASIVKRKIRTHVDQGHNVETIEDFIGALKGSPIAFTSVFLATVNRPKATSKSEIKNISSIHDVHVSKKDLIVRRYNGIGIGVVITKKKLVANKSKLMIEDQTVLCASESISTQDRKRLKKGETTTYWHSVLESSTRPKPVAKEIEQIDQMHTHNVVYFPCLQEGCRKQYRLLSRLEKHMMIGNHSMKPESVSLRDNVLSKYYNLTNDIQKNCLPKAITDAIQPIIGSNSNDIVPVERGWALATRKAAKRFNQKQREFLEELFKSGQESKAKFDGVRVERIMRTKLDRRGNPYFEPDELLDFAQINSYFSRLAAKNKIPDKTKTKKTVILNRKRKRQTDEEDCASEDEDENSPDYSLIGFKDALFPDLITEAENILRNSEIFELSN